MASHQAEVASTGLSILYTPKEEAPNVDIVFVHGLQGHPQNTWSKAVNENSAPSPHSTPSPGTPSGGKRHKFRQFFAPKARVVSQELNQDGVSGASQPTAVVFWPKDLLPTECPRARILTWGYDTVVTKGYGAATKNNIFAHARDLLYALEREREHDIPLIFVAHSLGGIIVKEVLRRAESSTEHHLKTIIESTRAIVFLGTPHRGSADMAALGDVVRRVASAVLRVDSNESILRALGTDSPELELCRESFITQWRVYDFAVKTFQESTGISGVNVGLANEKVVPDTSSSLDDPREHAETIPANHTTMCKFSGRDDPGYVKVGRELQRLAKGGFVGISKEADDCLKTLSFTEQDDRLNAIHPALHKTCDWLEATPIYGNWLKNLDQSASHGLLWLKGKPGTGKSTLIRDMFHRARALPGRTAVAAFFFSARGSTIANSPLGMFRSLLRQLATQDPVQMTHVLPVFHDKSKRQGGQLLWSQEELRRLLRQAFVTISNGRRPKRTLLFIDALDECDEREARDIVYYFRSLADEAFAAGSCLSICFSSRHYPTISIDRCPEITVENQNGNDIEMFIVTRLQQSASAYEPSEITLLKDRLVAKSDGVFLWAVLVVDLVLRDLDDGKPSSEIQETIRSVPEELAALFTKLFGSLKPNERRISAAMFQWLILIQRPLSGVELYHGMAFASESPKLKIEQIEEYLKERETNERIRRFVRSYSRGLIEVRHDAVQFIHESVREFFVSEVGLVHLDTAIENHAISDGHFKIIRACLNFLAIYHTCSDQQSELLWVDQWLLWYSWEYLLHHAVAVQHYGAPRRLYHIAVEISWRVSKWPKLLRSSQYSWRVSQLSRLLWSRRLRSSHLQHLTSAGLFWCNAGVVKCMELSNAKTQPLPDPLTTAVLQIREQTTSQQAKSRNILMDYRPISLVTSRKTSDIGEDLINMTDNCQETVLHRSIDLAYMDVALWLLLKGTRIDVADDRLRTPLHQAALYGLVDVVQALIQRGADVCAVDEEWNTALHLAVENPDETKSIEVVGMLIEAKCPVDAQNYWGQTALHCAIEASAFGSIKHLADHSSSYAIEDKRGVSVFPLARMYGKLSVNALMKVVDPREVWGGASTNPEKMMRSRNSHREGEVWKGPNALYPSPYQNHYHLVVPGNPADHEDNESTRSSEDFSSISITVPAPVPEQGFRDTKVDSPTANWQ